MNNASQLDEIKKINTKIDSLNNLHSQLEKGFQNFKTFFPNHAFGNNEKNMILTEINSLQNEINKISNTMKKGKKLNIKQISKVILESWGRTKIKITEINDNKDEFEYAQGIFQDECGLTFEQKDLQIIEYYLDTSNRSDLYLIRVFLAPGFAIANLDTDRVGWSTDVVSNEEFLKKIATEIESNT